MPNPVATFAKRLMDLLDFVSSDQEATQDSLDEADKTIEALNRENARLNAQNKGLLEEIRMLKNENTKLRRGGSANPSADKA